jgi:hypothetical protein
VLDDVQATSGSAYPSSMSTSRWCGGKAGRRRWRGVLRPDGFIFVT